MQGYDRCHYVNTMYPWDGKAELRPPKIDWEDNPVGSFVGYSEDSFTPSEFDITGYVKEQGNRIAVVVYKRSSASWIEDQDFFRF